MSVVQNAKVASMFFSVQNEQVCLPRQETALVQVKPRPQE